MKRASGAPSVALVADSFPATSAPVAESLGAAISMGSGCAGIALAAHRRGQLWVGRGVVLGLGSHGWPPLGRLYGGC